MRHHDQAHGGTEIVFDVATHRLRIVVIRQRVDQQCVDTLHEYRGDGLDLVAAVHPYVMFESVNLHALAPGGSR
ncbi:MAG: hypothetical protein ABI870_04420 [Rhodanobacter sp.]